MTTHNPDSGPDVPGHLHIRPVWPRRYSRREWLQTSAATAVCVGGGLAAVPIGAGRLQAAEPKPAQIAITLDLEMSRNFPDWEATHWDYEKGNLNEETKHYAVAAGRRVKAAGGVVHYFAVGRVFEQEHVEWAQELVEQGHPIGNHTYDHINVTATKPEELQFRFQRSPWLLRGQSVPEAIRENIRLCDLALRQRLGIAADGFRTPGGFQQGLKDLPHVRALLQESGFRWVSSLYPAHDNTEPGQQPTAAVIDSIVNAQRNAQPFAYPDGLVEIPMSPISDIGAFRTGRWQLEWFLTAVRESVLWAIDQQAVFDFLAHPSCLYVVDPQFRTIDLICELVAAAGSRAQLVGLSTLSERVPVTDDPK